MAPQNPQIAGIGNPLVDVLAAVDDEAPARHGLTLGEMHLISAATSAALFAEIGPGTQQSGGSVANTIAHLGDLGLRGTFLGKVADDSLGRVFRDEMAGRGITCPVTPLTGSVATGRCVVMVTPDGERTMSTYLGACEHLSPGDLPLRLPAETEILLVEGYHWDAPEGAANIEAAAKLAKEAGARIAMTPSDPSCVDRQRNLMVDFLESHCDILIGNEAEFDKLAQTKDPLEALSWARSRVEIAALTQSENGALVQDGGDPVHVPAKPVSKVVDSTGAGDAYAAGFLGGIALGESARVASVRGAALGARVISKFGAR